MMRITLVLLSVLVTGTALAVGACAKGEAQPQQQAAAPAAMPVTIGPVVRKAMPLDASVVGTVEAYSTVSVRAQITGELTAVHFQQGDDVEAGQELFTLDRRPFEAALLQAQANLERDTAEAANAKAIVQRYEQLVERGIVSREQRDNARTSVARLEATLASDRAVVENAKVQLQYATIRAPISGRTGALMVNAGNLVRANDQAPLVTINQVSPVYVSFALPEPLLPDLRRYMARGALRVEARPAERRRSHRRGQHHLRRQRRRSHDRHDQGQGDVPEQRPPAVAGPVRERRRAAGDRVRGDRRADRRRADRSRRLVRLPREAGSNRGAAAGHRGARRRRRNGDQGRHRRGRHRGDRRAPAPRARQPHQRKGAEAAKTAS